MSDAPQNSAVPWRRAGSSRQQWVGVELHAPADPQAAELVDPDAVDIRGGDVGARLHERELDDRADSMVDDIAAPNAGTSAGAAQFERRQPAIAPATINANAALAIHVVVTVIVPPASRLSATGHARIPAHTHARAHARPPALAVRINSPLARSLPSQSAPSSVRSSESPQKRATPRRRPRQSREPGAVSNSTLAPMRKPYSVPLRSPIGSCC